MLDGISLTQLITRNNLCLYSNVGQVAPVKCIFEIMFTRQEGVLTFILKYFEGTARQLNDSVAH